MSNGIPTQIGPYEITREIGRGGMGVVYLARDTKLDRDVAIKALPAEVAEDKERLERFEREAKLLASLNHPHIASIYGLEEVEDQRYLILEYVPGETLDERLERGPIPVDEALSLAVQIAEAIESAHEHGIIHRDLKPANIKFSGQEDDAALKVLDFGLAKALGDDAASGSDAETLAQSPTPVGSPTMPGVVLGTAGYLSPEQARGRPVDKRTDIFSFGCVLYEMLTGQVLFAGETVSDSIASTLKTDPDFDRLPPETPAQVRHVLKRCLERDRSRRLRDIGDARLELLEVQLNSDEDAAVPAGSRRHMGPLVAAMLALGGVIGGAIVWFSGDRTKLTPAPVTRFEIDLQREGALSITTGPSFAIDSAGRRLAYVLQSDVAASLYVRELDEPEGRLVVSGPILEHPFFSPDGQWIGYFSRSHLNKVAINGGSPIELAGAIGGLNRGGTWGPDDTIVFSPDTTSPLMRVSAAGGPAEAVTTLDASRQERSHRWPAFVPGRADRIVFTSQTLAQEFDEVTIELLDLSTGARHVLHQHGSYGRITPDGHLLFALNDAMFGCALSDDLTAPLHAPVPVVNGLTSSRGNGGAQFSFSDSGIMICVVGARGGTGESIPRWVDFESIETLIFSEPTDLFSPAISPDGTRIAFHEGYGDAIVVLELQRGIQSPVYPTEFRQYRPIWSPDGKRIVFSGQTEEHFVPSLMIVPADGETAPVRVGKGDLQEQLPSDWSRDGTMILFDEPQPDTRRDIFIYHVETGEIETVVASRADDQYGRFSPNGDWIVYDSDLSGTHEIYLRRLDGAGSRLQVSVGGGAAPRWAPDGASVYYMVSRLTMTGRAGTLMRVAIDLTIDPPTIGAPEPAVELKPRLFSDREYDIDPSGERILVLRFADSVDAGSSERIHLVMNWFEELERKLSGNGGSP